MNGRELSGNVRPECLGPTETAPSSSDDTERERWAALAAGALIALPIEAARLPLAAPSAAPVASGTTSAVPDGWRPSVGDLTPLQAQGEVVSGRSAAIAPSGEGDASDLQRIQVRVNTEEFGEVAVTIERAEQGLRILMGAVDGRVVSALRHEALAVRRAIENGGQTVGSFEIVRMNEVGTNLAQTQVAPGNRARRLKDTAESGQGPLDRKNKKLRRLNLIG